ncbi:saccharopine dehydrogenase-like NADP-dependent oxidoreductase [Thermosediminibacter litoriperuensis]|uniref:Saccharopine dehydrogenase-like NADP-dependent oxidoreductase n=1 Tax=Thermosediminibacter litoriperuensis TaxID=291989 RepID=A0A5S5AED0_9FIRM|nr:saccharopine dehydrogenase C-terminal domain-containing protein [Thermosediminibacter litoriperuensis]TYP48400.1 saccharopine dehydrogenase-like NADP-dependent oxidoreductase [Thermosediminibacter litoriperuensis]
MKIVVFGAGLVGSVIARDLAREWDVEVTVADGSDARVKQLTSEARVKGIVEDLSKPGTIRQIASDFDMAVGALPGFMGKSMVKQVIEAGRNIVDISFSPEDYRDLDGLAREKGVTAVIDCGVAPGMSNILVARGASVLDEPESAVIYVGGLPQVRHWPYEYKIVFSPIDVIEEYTRPARVVENGNVVAKPALSELELIDFPGIGTLEAFNTDGLRTLVDTVKIPNMKEKTLRFPGHAEKMRILRETGFFGYDPVDVNGVQVRPIDVTARLLFPLWEMKEGDRDFTVMRVEVEGKKGGRKVRCVWEMVDYYDEKTGTTSMARTTGYTASVIARFLAAGVFKHKGICPPELIATDENAFRLLLAELEAKGIIYREKIIEI